MAKIKAVYGPTFQADGEVTCGATVGHNGVTQIVQRVEFGILWFDVFGALF